MKTEQQVDSKWLDRVFIALMVGSLVLIAAVMRSRKVQCDVVRSSDTIYVHDTIIRPVAIDSLVLYNKIVKLPIYLPSDTVFNSDTIRDSVLVEIPVQQKIYEDSTYKAWVSGYQPNLDSIIVKSKLIRQTNIVKQKPSRWSIGIQAGGGFGYQGITPYVGIGINYSIFLLSK